MRMDPRLPVQIPSYVWRGVLREENFRIRSPRCPSEWAGFLTVSTTNDIENFGIETVVYPGTARRRKVVKLVGSEISGRKPRKIVKTKVPFLNNRF